MGEEEKKKALAAMNLGGKKPEDTTALGASPASAGITAGASLLGGLLANQAAEQAQARALQSESEKMVAEEQAKARAQAQQSQQNALTRLMANFRSALT